MREIKFRAWNIGLKKFATWPVVLSPNGNLEEPEGGRDLQGHRDNERYVIMQFTGLKDKNGVEIYEGDIVRFSDGHYLCMDDKINVAKVYFEDGAFYPFCCVLGEFDCAEDVANWCDVEKCEVIGNIYENPEVLK